MKILLLGVFVSLLQLLSNCLVDTLTGARARPRRAAYYEDFFTYFINEAPLYDANYDKNFTRIIPWADVNLLRESADFHRRNYVGISIMQMNSLLEALALKTISSVEMTTKGFNDVPRAYERLLKTYLYARLLCLSGPGILDEKSDAGRGIELVRKLHRSAAYVAENRSLAAIDALQDNSVGEFSARRDVVPDSEIQQLVQALRADLAAIDTSEAPKDIAKWDWSKPVGQFDLAVGQFFFYGHVVFSPQVFGIYSATEREIKAHTHFWAVVGRMLGIEDRFNLALHLPTAEHERFYRNVIVASFKNAEERNIRQMANMMEGLYRNFPIPTAARFKCWIFFFLKKPMPQFEGRNILQLMNLEDIVCLQYMGVLAGPIQLSYTFKIMSRLAFDSWFQQEMERLGLKYEI